MFFERAINLDQYLKQKFHYNENDPDILKVIPEQDACSNCATKLKLIKKGHNGFILLTVVATCQVYISECTNKDCIEFSIPVSYSGSSSGMVNYSNKFFIGVELIVEYMSLYSKNGLSFSTWIGNKIVLNQSISERNFYRDVGHISSYYGILHEIFCRATDLFVFPKDTFFCCANPKVVQMDGLVNSIKANRIPDFREPWIKDTVTERASNFNERQLEPVDETTKKLICDIIQTKKCNDSILLNLQKSKHIGVKALSFCFKRQENLNILNDSAMLFAKTLTKTIAAANSLMPSSCENIVIRYVFKKCHSY